MRVYKKWTSKVGVEGKFKNLSHIRNKGGSKFYLWPNSFVNQEENCLFLYFMVYKKLYILYCIKTIYIDRKELKAVRKTWAHCKLAAVMLFITQDELAE